MRSHFYKKIFMKKTFAIINAQIVSHKEIFMGSVQVKDGKITKVSKDLFNEKVETIDLKGKYLLPGLIDPHVHFRTPGFPEKEDWVTGSKAALAGGVTTVLDMPNTKPPTTDASSLALKRAMVSKDALVNYGFFAGATNNNVDDVMAMKGIAGVKIFMGSSTGSLLVDDKGALEKFMQAGIICALHAEDEQCIHEAQAKCVDREDAAVHSLARPPECAALAVKEALTLAKKYGTEVHICHASTKAELDVIRGFKNDHISVEVTPHHLFLNTSDYDEYGTVIKVNPPIRDASDQAALWDGINDGTVTMIGTDHAPHLMQEKQLPYSQAPSGLPGVQTSLPLLLTAVNEGKITLQKVVELTSYNPARRFGMKGKGVIEEGADADLVVVDMELEEKVCHHFLWTKVDWSPFHGWWLKGWPVMTFVGGELAYEWRDTFYKVKGREVEFAQQG
jgi:dihydroorotase